MPFFALLSSARRTFRYHIGTAAVGSLLNHSCRLIRPIFGVRMTKNSFSPCMCGGCLCFVSFREYLRRFNGNAYIMCSMNGKGYNDSALDAYQLILRNCSRYISTTLVSRLVFCCTKLLLACATGAVVYLYYGIHIVAPLFGLTYGAFFILRLFFSVYSTAVDTLVLCARKYLIIVRFGLRCCGICLQIGVLCYFLLSPHLKYFHFYELLRSIFKNILIFHCFFLSCLSN